jgi:hypothetical protein
LIAAKDRFVRICVHSKLHKYERAPPDCRESYKHDPVQPVDLHAAKIR